MERLLISFKSSYYSEMPIGLGYEFKEFHFTFIHVLFEIFLFAVKLFTENVKHRRFRKFRIGLEVCHRLLSSLGRYHDFSHSCAETTIQQDTE